MEENDKYGPNDKYKPIHGGYPGKQNDDCVIDRMIRRHAEKCYQLNEKEDYIKVLKARIDYVEAEWVTQEARVSELETELSRRKVKITLLEERLNPKPKWEEGVIAVEENRMLTSDEYGIYYHWSKEREDSFPGINYKGKHSLFVSDFVYQLVVFQDAPPPQPKPL